MHEHWLFVARRGVDPAAETCALALRDLMHEPVAGVERGELWRFEVDAAAEDARARLEAAAGRSGRYVNLNRDVCAWLEAPRPYPRSAPRPGHAVDVWVCDGDGRDATALEYFRRVEPGLAGLRRGILWRLWLPGRDPEAARALALAIARTRARDQGLLCNPHFQSADVLAVVGSGEAG